MQQSFPIELKEASVTSPKAVFKFKSKLNARYNASFIHGS